MKGKALIIYSSITGNTAKVAGWFQETFEHYNMEVTSIRVKNKMDCALPPPCALPVPGPR